MGKSMFINEENWLLRIVDQCLTLHCRSRIGHTYSTSCDFKYGFHLSDIKLTAEELVLVNIQIQHAIKLVHNLRRILYSQRSTPTFCQGRVGSEVGIRGSTIDIASYNLHTIVHYSLYRSLFSPG